MEPPQPQPSYLLVKLLVPCCSRLEKLFTVEDSVLIVQVILHFPGKENVDRVLRRHSALRALHSSQLPGSQNDSIRMDCVVIITSPNRKRPGDGTASPSLNLSSLCRLRLNNQLLCNKSHCAQGSVWRKRVSKCCWPFSHQSVQTSLSSSP